jgi:hypothetical protein
MHTIKYILMINNYLNIKNGLYNQIITNKFIINNF